MTSHYGLTQIINELTHILETVLPASVEFMGDIVPIVNSFLILGKTQCYSENFSVSISLSGGSFNRKACLSVTLDLVSDGSCVLSTVFNFVSQKLYHLFSYDCKYAPPLIISFLYISSNFQLYFQFFSKHYRR